MLTSAVDEGNIVGVSIPEVADQITHSQFANNTSIVIRAERVYIDNLFHIFRMLGRGWVYSSRREE